MSHALGAQHEANKGTIKVSDLFVRCLEGEGVEYIFGLPGEETPTS